MKTSKLIPAIACIGVLIPVVLFARTVEPLLRECRGQVIEEYHTALIDAQRQYNDELEQAMEERKQGYVESWNQEDDGDVRRIQRDADRRYSQRTSDARKAKRDQDRLASKTYSDSRRHCSSEASSRSSASRDSSRSSSLSNRSSSSKTSSSRTSSSYSSSHPNPPPPPQCNDIVCSDGRHFPTCTPSGAVVNYFQYPCNTPPPPQPPPPPPFRTWCFNDSYCSAGYRCQTGNGICERPCDDPNAVCPAVCAGRCVIN